MGIQDVRFYCRISALIFTVLAVAQLVRAATGLPVSIGSFQVPLAVSWFAALVAGVLAVWGWRVRIE